MSADGYDVGSIMLDQHDTIWMGWGKAIRTYDPATGILSTWNLPPYSGLAVLYSMDGRIMSLTVDQTGEVWVVASMVTGVFGFNPVTRTWDRTINLRFVPVQGSMLAAPATGILTLNGSALNDQPVPVFAVITVGAKAVRMLPAEVYTYAVAGPNQVLYFDKASNLGLLDLAQGTATVLMPNAPVYRNTDQSFQMDARGRLWFPMFKYRWLGVGVFDPATRAITGFVFPYITNPGSPVPNDCPTGAFHCVPSGTIADPGIDGIAVDTNAHVWVITESPARADPNQTPLITAVMELQTGQ